MKICIHALIKSRAVIAIGVCLILMFFQLAFSGISSPLYAQSEEPINILLKIDGIYGESQIRYHEKEIDVLAVGFSLGNPDSTGAEALPAITIVKRIDKSSVTLTKIGLTDKVVKQAIITYRKGGERPLDFYQLLLGGVSVLSVTMHTDNVAYPTETIVLSPRKIEWRYTPQKADGSGDATIYSCWNFVIDQECASSLP
jgi:type VI secretion system secreted protein Hcp